MNVHVAWAVFRRNFIAYFSNPTGYVFICVFVLLSAIAAFWPYEFFNANLANLDQLNKYFPLIMLVFIPAITMSIWAEERRQGTDELLLTIPASDWDVVAGKYLAAVGIFTVALAFSLFNWVVLRILGEPDRGLILSTYFGYWLVGLAMLAIGMAASFFTANLTVSFILGALFNLPLVFAAQADVLSGLWKAQTWVPVVRRLSVAEQFLDFGRGVISLSGLVYFAGLVAAMLYASLVLIGRRHWMGGRDGQSLVGHYLMRFICLALVVAALATIAARFDRRVDLTQEQLTALSPQARTLISKIDDKRPVRIEAYISPQVPESYVPTRLNLLSMLREIEALGRGKVRVTIYPTEQFSEAADRAEKQFGIKGREVYSRRRGAMSMEQVYLGVAFMCGLEKVVVPFFDRGIPAEYEVIRSVATVSQQARKRVGVLTTDAKLYGGFNMQTMASTQNEQIIEELQKQYEVVQVNPDSPITEKYDVLLAVQPSSLTQPQLDNFLAAVKSGQPTAIFEDPFPYIDSNVPATSAPKNPPGGANPFMNSGPPQPKGDITALWRTLGVNFNATEVIWQSYNPYPKIEQFPPEFVFVDYGSGQTEPFNAKNAISAQLQRVLFLFPGAIYRQNAAGVEFIPLARTSDKTGVVQFEDIMEPGFMGRGGALNRARRFRPTQDEYVVAVRITGKAPDGALLHNSDAGNLLALADEAAPPSATDVPAATEAPATTDVPAATEVPAAPATPSAAGTPPATDGTFPGSAAPAPTLPAGAATPGKLDVVLVADIDVLYGAFFRLREQGSDPEAEVSLDLDNVPFVLNTLDSLAGDDRFIEIRNRRRKHRALSKIEEWTKKIKEQAAEANDEFVDKFNKERERAQLEFDDRLEEIRKSGGNRLEQLQKLQMAEEVGRQQLEARTQELKNEMEREKNRINRELTLNIRRVQDRCKLFAVLVPPILPLLLGVVVFVNRRAREHEGVARSRLR